MSERSVRVTVFHVASKVIKVQVPGELDHDATREFVRKTLNAALPEVHEESTFELATGFQLEGDDFETDLDS